MADWKKPVPESLCSLMFMQVYIWAGSGAACVCLSVLACLCHCQSVLVRSELESQQNCTPSSAPSACGCSEISWAVMGTNKTHKSICHSVLEHTFIIMSLIILHFCPFSLGWILPGSWAIQDFI